MCIRDRYLSAALPEYQDADARRLLASGDYLSRLWPMALVYRMEKDARYKNLSLIHI